MSVELSTDSYEETDTPSWDDTSTTWNGREVRTHQKETLTEIATRIIQEQIASIDLKNQTIEDTFEYFIETNNYEYDQGNIQLCKSFKGHCRRLYKETKKGYKKAEKVAKKTFHGTKDFVKEHKKEILIIGAAALGVVGIGLGIAALARSKEEDEAPPPTPKIPSAPPSRTTELASTSDQFSPPPELLASAPKTYNFIPPQGLTQDTSIQFGTPLPTFPSFQTTEKIKFLEPEKNLFNLKPTEKQLIYNSQLEVWGNSTIDQTFMEARPTYLPKLEWENPTINQTIIETQPIYNPQFKLFGNSTIDQTLVEIQPTYNPQLEVWEYPSTPNILSSAVQAIKYGLEAIRLDLNELDPTKVPSPESSRIYKTHGIAHSQFLFTYINGMDNTFEEAVANAQYLRSLTPNLQILGIYNKTNSVPIDGLEIFSCNYLGYSPITADLLINTWTDFFKKNAGNPHAMIFHTCHSQGAIHTKNALEKLPRELRNRIVVLAIAPAVIITRDLCLESFNYASKNDIVHLGQNTSAIMGSMFLNDPDMQSDTVHKLIVSKSELILLEPHKDAKGMDHNYMSPTFIDESKRQINTFFKNYEQTE